MVTDVGGAGGVLTFGIDFASAAPANDPYSGATISLRAPPYTISEHDFGHANTGAPIQPPRAHAAQCMAADPQHLVQLHTNQRHPRHGGHADQSVTTRFYRSGRARPARSSEVACSDNASAPDGSQVLQSQVSFNAAASTTYHFMVSSVLADGGTSQFHLTLTSPGTANLTLLPNPVTFATTVVGNASPVQSVTLTNNGPGSVTVTSINLTAGNTGDFIGAQQSGDCSDGGNGATATTLAVNASCNVHGEFTPTAAGARSATLTIAASGAANSPSTTLQGTGTAAVGTASVSASPSPANFTDRAVGTTSAILTSVVTNVGPGSATITNINSNNSGSITTVTPLLATDCQTGTVLAPSGAGSSCNLRWTFTPSSPGLQSMTATLLRHHIG